MHKQRTARLFTISFLVCIPLFGICAGAGERDASGYLNYAAPEDFRRTGLKDEIIEAGYKGTIYSAMDGDVY